VFRLGVLSSDILLPSDVVFWQHPLLAPFHLSRAIVFAARLSIHKKLRWVG
jgi:hypothetical protein